MIYILCFVASTFLFYISKSQYKRTRLCIDCIAILIPCVLAALRANTVGTDVGVYLEPMFRVANNSTSFRDYLRGSWSQGWTIRVCTAERKIIYIAQSGS